ncbi:polycomb group protein FERTILIZATION-INDEPENDENT ENDOSPERM-like isoform X2 [Sesamum indicum]|uniref:Polycomb group protein FERTILIZATION-INDEPENDENT ENDOSPERM-like isoform X2 n=1 Tax=Sesamum indicum TaxID=4182 RepID=A0A6I9UBU5_SESIN|nr:polycomb group protein FERTILIZATION-INDEPENDENT ENDOSPERM-like isoform X2 [Sesamum indicum]
MAKIPLGCEPVVGSLTPSQKREYRATNRLQEGKRPIYAVVFNFIDSRYFNAFATTGGNRVTVYQCVEGGVIAVLQSYIDEDKDESFYTVSWACNIDGTPFLVAGGLNGIIRVIDTGSEKIYKDESVRLWNIHTGICILIFAGAGGHRNEVLSVQRQHKMPVSYMEEKKKTREEVRRRCVGTWHMKNRRREERTEGSWEN